jgi:hypothetical protein
VPVSRSAAEQIRALAPASGWNWFCSASRPGIYEGKRIQVATTGVPPSDPARTAVVEPSLACILDEPLERRAIENAAKFA